MCFWVSLLVLKVTNSMIYKAKKSFTVEMFFFSENVFPFKLSSKMPLSPNNTIHVVIPTCEPFYVVFDTPASKNIHSANLPSPCSPLPPYLSSPTSISSSSASHHSPFLVPNSLSLESTHTSPSLEPSKSPSLGQ